MITKLCFSQLVRLLAAVLLLTCVACAGESQPDEYLDQRDQVVYPLVTIGTQKWFGSDLRYATPRSFCYENVVTNCTQYGRLYNYQEAKTACPEGWRLPNEQDWQQLERSLGMADSELAAIRVWRGTDTGARMADQLGVPFSGTGKAGGKEFIGLDQLVYYWVDEQGPSGHQYALYRMLSSNKEQIYRDQLLKSKLACVRCVRVAPFGE